MLKNKLPLLIWAGNFFTKPIYLFIAWQQHQGGIISTEGNSPAGLIFLGMGIAASIAGIVITKELSKNDSAILSIYSRLYEKSLRGEQGDPRLALFTVSLGLVETSSLFGLISYLMGYDVRISLVLAGVWFVAWIFCKPEFRD